MMLQPVTAPFCNARPFGVTKQAAAVNLVGGGAEGVIIKGL